MKNGVSSFLSFLGVLLTSADLILKLFHSNLCSTQGCLLMANSVRYSDSLIVAAGLFVFIILFMANVLWRRRFDYVAGYLLTIALSVEGVFVGYQLFRVKHICTFCISILLIFIALAIVRLIEKKDYAIISGFVSFFAIVTLFYLLKPVNIIPALNKPLVLIYKENCPHCENILQEAKQNKVNICTIKAGSCMDMLKSLNIKEVPILIVNKKQEKKIIIGETNILQYLLNKQNIPKNNLYNTIFKDKKGFCTIGEKCK